MNEKNTKRNQAQKTAEDRLKEAGLDGGLAEAAHEEYYRISAEQSFLAGKFRDMLRAIAGRQEAAGYKRKPSSHGRLHSPDVSRKFNAVREGRRANIRRESVMTYIRTIPSIHVCFVVDTSSSMSGQSIQDVKDLFVVLTKGFQEYAKLNPRKRLVEVSMIRYSCSAEQILPVPGLSIPEQMMYGLAHLVPDGGTYEAAGLKLVSYKRDFDLNFVIGLTDGCTHDPEQGKQTLDGLLRQGFICMGLGVFGGHDAPDSFKTTWRENGVPIVGGFTNCLPPISKLISDGIAGHQRRGARHR